MAYLPPSYTVVDFDFTGAGYSAPSFNLVDFNIDPPPGVVFGTATFTLSSGGISFLRSSYYNNISQASYTLTNNPILFNRSLKLSITPAIYTLNLYLNNDTPFIIHNVSYSITASNIGLNKGPVLPIDLPTEYIDTHKDINMSKLSILPVTSYTSSVIVGDLILNYGKTHVIDSASYTLTNSDLAFSRNYALAIDVNASTVTAQYNSLFYNKTFAISAATYTLTNQPIVIGSSTFFPIGTASFSTSLLDVTMRQTNKLQIGSTSLNLSWTFYPSKQSYHAITTGSYTLTTNPILFNYNRYMTLFGSYTVTNQPISLSAQRLITLLTSYSLTHNPINLNRIITQIIDTNAITLTYNDFGTLSGKLLTTTNGTFSLNYNLIDLLKKSNLTISSSSFLLNYLLSLDYDRIFSLNVANYLITTSPLLPTSNFEYTNDVRLFILQPFEYIHIIDDTPNIQIDGSNVNIFDLSSNNNLFIN